MTSEGEEPLLTDEETSALLDAMREEEIRDRPEAQRTELGSPEGPLREALGRADACLGALAEAARDQLLRQTVRGVQLELLPAEIVPRDVLLESFDDRALRYHVRCRGHRYGHLVIDPGLARYVLDRSLGGEPDEASPASGPRPFSELDRRVIRPFPVAVLSRLGQTFLDGLAVELIDPNAAEEEESLHAVRFEPLLRLGLRVSAGGQPAGDLTIALTATAVSSSSGDFEHEPRTLGDDARAQVSARLVNAAVELSAVLGSAPSSIRALLSLREGDVLRLDRTPDDEVPVVVDDVVVATGVPVVHHGNLAIEVRSRSTTRIR